MHAAEPLPHFVDDYLAYLYEVHPTGATHGRGPRPRRPARRLPPHARSTRTSSALAGFARRLDGIPVDAAPAARAGRAPDRRGQHPRAPVRARSASGPGSATRTSTPRRWRRAWRRRRSSPTRPRPSAPAACCRSCGRCRGSCRRRATTSRTRRRSSSRSASTPGAARCRSSTPTCRARSRTSTTCTCSATWPTRAPKRCRPSAPTSTISRPTSARRPRASFRLGRDRFEQKLRLDEGITLPVDRLLAIATRELAATQEEFRQLAGRLNGGDPIEAWRKAKQQHPAAGHADRRPRASSSTSCTRSSRATRSCRCPTARGVAVAPTPEFFRWSSASMWTPGPFEPKPSRAMYYLTDVDP